MNACPETPDLLDHIEGRADLSTHVAGCDPCSSALSDLRAALAVETRAVSVTPFDVERALASVQARARASHSRRWQTTFFFSAAAAAAVFFMLPGTLPGTLNGPTSGAAETGGPGQAVTTVPANVDVPKHLADEVMSNCSSTSVAIIRTTSLSK